MGNFVLAKKGKLLCRTKALNEMDPVSRFAGKELEKYLEKCFQGKPAKTSLPLIILDSGDKQKDGFRVAIKNNQLHIYGYNPRSLLFGVYAFLKRYCGCGWFYPGHEYIPLVKDVCIRLQRPWIQKPNIQKRGIYPEGQKFSVKWIKALIDWAPKNGISDITVSMSAWPKWKMALSSHIKRRGLSLNVSGHCLPFFIPKPCFDKHSDWFALINGKRRQDAQYCFSCSGFGSELKKRILAYIKQEPLLKRISIWAQDNSLKCECAKCRRNGFVKSFVNCINRVATECKRKFPDVKIEFLAYNAALDWDMLEPEKSLHLSDCSTELAYWGRDYRYSINRSKYIPDKRAVKCFRKWKKITKNPLHVLEYYTDLWMNTHLNPPLPTIITRDSKAYKAMGINDLTTLITICKNDVSEQRKQLSGYRKKIYMNLYFYSALMWDPSFNALEDFCNKFYGHKARTCKKYILKLEKTLARITSFNQEFFRLRFVDPWFRDETPKQGGIKFRPVEWTPDMNWRKTDEKRLKACKEMVDGLKRFEMKNPCSCDKKDNEYLRELKHTWDFAVNRLKGYRLQFKAQLAMSQGNWGKAKKYLSNAVSLKNGLSVTDKKICKKWLFVKQ